MCEVQFHDGHCDHCGDHSTHIYPPTEGEVDGLCPQCHKDLVEWRAEEEREERMLGDYDVTEADEAATDKHTALSNLTAQVSQGETPAIIDMYERAAWGVGASVLETESAIKRGRKS
jgi:hypothetical protein